MDLSAILPPANGRIFAAASSEFVCAKLLLSCNRLASRQYNVSVSKHTGWSGHLNSFVTQPCKPLSLSLQIHAATWEGDTDNGFTETLVKSEIGEPYETVEAENQKVEQSIEDPSYSHTQWIGGKYASRDNRDITLPLDALKSGAILTGKITNIERFGAFVDVGAFSSGLIHISNLANGYVRSVKDIVKVGDEVKVQVISVDVSSKRISLKLIKEYGDLNVSPGYSNPLLTETLLTSEVGETHETFETENKKVEQSIEACKDSDKQWINGNYTPLEIKNITVPLDALKGGATLMGKVTKVLPYGAFVDVGAFSSGLIHISNLTNKYVRCVEDIVKVGDEVKVQVLSVNVPSKRVSLKLIREDGDLNMSHGHPNPLVTQPSEPVSGARQTHSATGEGDTVTDICFTETLMKSESGAYETFQTKNEEEWSNQIHAPQESEGTTVTVDALKHGAILTGTVMKIEPFGAFVDVGAFSRGLIHISNMANKFVRSVEDIVKVGEEVKVQVLSVDVPSKRISLKLVTDNGDLKMSPGCSNPLVTQPCKPYSLSSRTYAATAEGGTVTDNGFTDSSESEVGEACKTVETGNEKVEQSIEGSKKSGNYAPLERKNIAVPLDALKPGAVLAGRVTKIANFGAFVDVGAFSSGLIHISKMTNKFVRSVEDFLKVGDHVKVQVLFVDVPSKRISLKLITEDGDLKVEKQDNFQQHKEASRKIPQKSSLNAAGKPQKGELFTGSVESIVSTGVFVTLKQGHVGFLPASEVLPSGQTTSYFRVGQQLPVRVIRTTRHRVVLTMRKQAVVGSEEGSEEVRATSPFELAFRRNKVIAKFLEDRERLLNLSEANVENGSVIGSGTEEGCVKRNG